MSEENNEAQPFICNQCLQTYGAYFEGGRDHVDMPLCQDCVDENKFKAEHAKQDLIAKLIDSSNTLAQLIEAQGPWVSKATGTRLMDTQEWLTFDKVLIDLDNL